MSDKRLNRRSFLRSAAMAAVGMVAVSCSQPTPQVIEKEVPVEKVVKETVVVEKQVPVEKVVKETVVVEKEVPIEKVVTATPMPSTFKEAPMLASMVQAGQLSPVEERLPEEPLVLEPVERVGSYGGTWIMMQTGTGFGHMQMANYTENFLKYTRDTTGQRPNILTKWQWNNDGTEITIYFRKGIKWSDGEPLTANDWVWWWDNMVLDDNVALAPPLGSNPAGERMTIVKVDDYTLRCQFAVPNPLFLGQMTRGQGARATSFQIVPAHYLQQFHYRFNTNLSNTDVADLIDHFNNRTLYPDMPHNGPWIVTQVEDGVRCTLERNPYYWKVDTQGNQLPYMDGMEDRVTQNAELIALSCISGEIDFQVRQLNLQDLPLLKENEVNGNYRIRMWKQGNCGEAGLLFHYCYPDESITDLLWNRNMRLAMSYAIDRERINDIVFLGLARPRQIAMFPDGEEFQGPRGQQVLQDWENHALEHDPDQARALLDEIGVVDSNNDGFREKPDGSPLELIIDVDVASKPEVDTMQLVQEDYKQIGLNLVLNVIDGAVLSDRARAAESMLRSRGGAASGLIAAPAHWTPVEFNEYCIAGPPYGRYYQTNGREGIPVPPGSFLEELQQVYTDAIVIVDPATRNDRILDGYQIHIDEGPIQIGTVGDTLSPVVVSNRLINVPPMGVIGSWTYGWPGSGDPEQWFKTS